MKSTRTAALAAAFASITFLSATNTRAQFVDPDLLDYTTSNPLGKVTSATASSALAGDDPFEAFGKPTGPVEAGTFLFADGNPVGASNTLTFGTSTPVTLAGIQLQGGAAGPPFDPRRIGAIFGTADLNQNGSLADDTEFPFETDFPDSGDGGAGVKQYLFPVPITTSLFQIRLLNQDGAGLRIAEIDAIVPEPGTAAALGLIAATGLMKRRRRI